MKPKFDGVLILIEILYIIILIFGIEYACEETIRFLDTGGINMSAEWIEILKNGSIGAAIGAVASLVGSYFMYLGKSKKILEIVQELKGERYNQIREDSKELSQKNDKLSAGHDKLSAGHDKLSAGHDKLSAEHDKLKEDLFKIYLNQEKEKTAREAAAKQIPEEGKLLDLVKMVYDNHTKLIERNKELMMEVSMLKTELAQYRQNYEQEDIEFSEYEMVPDDREMEML